MGASKASRMKTILVAIAAVISLLLLAIVMMSFGVAAVGGISNWEAALEGASPYLLALRIAIYGGLACLWLKVKRRVVENDEDHEAGARMNRAGIGGALCICLFELSRAGLV